LPDRRIGARRRSGALEDDKRRVTVVDKANVLRSYAFFRQVADQVLSDYPDIEAEHAWSSQSGGDYSLWG